MARLPRADGPGTWHHVIQRGIAKRPLFESRDDLRYFLSRLALQVRAGRIELHAFALVTTHFHLLVRSPRGELSEALRRAQYGYSRWFNRRRARDGPMVRGRFFSNPVRSAEYRRALVRYIDANPIRAGLVQRSRDWVYGSAAAYLGARRPPWLSCSKLEADACEFTGESEFTPRAYARAFGVGGPREQAALADLVTRRERSRAHSDPLDHLVAGASDDVRNWMIRKATAADGHRPDQPVCGPAALDASIESDHRSNGEWVVSDGRRAWLGAEVARVGLLRGLCGCSWAEVAAITGGSQQRARRLGCEHRRLLGAVPEYAARVARIGRAAVSAAFQRRVGGAATRVRAARSGA